MSLSTSLQNDRRLLAAMCRAARVSLVLLCALASTAIAQQLPSDGGRRQLEELESVFEQGRRESERDGEGGEDIHSRLAWFNYMRSYPYGAIPANGRVEALRATERLEQTIARARAVGGKSPSLFAASQWESIGPINQGGRIRAIAVHESQPGLILVGAAAGGVWRSTNGGESWTPTFDKESAISVGSLAFDPSNPSTVYAGTGENFENGPSLLASTPAYLGNGVFRSTDAGVTWEHIGLEGVGAVSKIHVHSANSSIIYAAVAKQNGGFYRTTDGGATWSRTVSDDLYDLTVNPQNNDEVFVASRNAIRRSRDAGATFDIKSSGIINASAVRMSVSLSGAQPSRLFVLVARGFGDNQVAEIYRSDNSGDSWQASGTFSPQFFRGQGGYDNFIVAHPTDPEVALAGGIDVYRTSDGGESWENVTRVYTGGSVHPDQHVAVFDPGAPDVVFLGNDGGVYISFDLGTQWLNASRGLAVTQYYRMEVDQTRPFRVFGGTQDNGSSGSFGTSGFDGNWQRVLGGDGFFVAMDYSDPNFFFAELYYGQMYRIDMRDVNRTQRIDHRIPVSGPNADPGAWATPIAMSEADKVSLYSGRSSLYRTTDRGLSWTKMNVGGNAKLSAIGLSPTDDRKIVVGTLGGMIRFSTDKGATWATGTGAGGGVVTDLRFDPVDPNRVYAAFSGFSSARVFRSDDNGASWTNISSNMPSIPVNAIEIDPLNTQHLFAATDVGVFFSPDGGNFWVPFNPGLPLAPISGLRIHRSSRMLVASTHGRSMFRVSIDDIVVEPTLISPVGGERFSTPGTIDVSWFGFDAPVDIAISYSSGEPFQTVASGVTGASATIAVPMRITSTARIRVQESGSGREVISGTFSLSAQSNATSLGRRSFHAEAIEMRGPTIWATARGTDSIYRLRLPLLAIDPVAIVSQIPGSIRDLAYDAERDAFFALVTGEDFTAPQIHRMDTTGALLGTLALPSELGAITGIAMRGTQLAAITPGPSPVLWILDPTTGAEIERHVIENASGVDRRGLVFNGRAFVQGVSIEPGQTEFDSELQQINTADPARVFEHVPVVLPSSEPIRFFGLTHDPVSATEYYFATDTAGAIYRFHADVLSGVDGDVMRRTGGSIAITSLRPNPVVDRATVELDLARGGELSFAIVDARGARHATLGRRTVEAGRVAVDLDVASMASGLYYLVVELGAERVVRPLSIVR